MAIRPSVPEIITVNSEELQTQIRDLLPSQNGFGSELQATNVITPIIDLTRAAEGSQLDYELQSAISFGSQSAFSISGATTVIATGAAFYRIFGMSNIKTSASATESNTFQLSDGLSTKNIWQHAAIVGANNLYLSEQYDFIVWLSPGHTLSGISTGGSTNIVGSVRQIADSTGTLTNPVGFPL